MVCVLHPRGIVSGLQIIYEKQRFFLYSPRKFRQSDVLLLSPIILLKSGIGDVGCMNFHIL